MNEVTFPSDFSGNALRAIMASAGKGEETVRVFDPQGGIICYAISTAGWQVMIDKIVQCYEAELKRPYHTQNLGMLMGLENILKLLGADEALANLPKR